MNSTTWDGFEDARGKMGVFVEKLRESKSKRSAALAALAIAGASMIGGGLLLTASVAAAIITGMLWLMIMQSEKAYDFVKRFGKVVDICVTIVGIFFTPLPGVLGFLTGAMIGAFFTIGRMLFCGDQ